MADGRALEATVDDLEIGDLVFVANLDAQILGSAVKGIKHGPPPAEEERIRPPQADRPAERRLEPHTLLLDPIEHRFRLGDHHPRQRFVGVAIGHAHRRYHSHRD